MSCSQKSNSDTAVLSLSIDPKKSMSEETAALLAEEYMLIDSKLKEIGSMEESSKAVLLLDSLVPEAEKLMDKIKEYDNYSLLSAELTELSAGRDETDNQYLEKCIEFAGTDRKFESAYERFVSIFVFN